MSESAQRPTRGTSVRLARLGITGASMVGRSAVARMRKVGAGAERRREIDAATHERNATQLFQTLSGMKGAATKIGQLLAQQTHTLPEAYTRRLADLHWQAPPMHGTLARTQVRQQLGHFPERIFSEFERQPFAAASLGQVHRARRSDGTPVAVKIQYPGIDRTLESDLRIFEGMLKALGWSRPEYPEVWEAVEEVREQLLREVDYRQEAAAMKEFRRLLSPRKDVIVPRSFPEQSTDRILTMELVTGSHPGEDSSGDEENERIAGRLLDLFFHQTFELGYLHADPHPGNFLFRPDGRLALLDFGCTKHLPKKLMDSVRELFRVPLEETEEHERLYQRLGFLDPDAADQKDKKRALAALLRLDLLKYHQREPFDFGDSSYLQRMNQALADLARLGIAQREFIFYMRARLGLYHLFHQLGAKVPCRDIVRPYLGSPGSPR